MNSYKQYIESSFLMYTMNYIILMKIHICTLITSFIAGLMANCQLLLPWCVVIAGYEISSDNTNSQRKPTVGGKQTSKSLRGLSPPSRVKTITNTKLK